MDGEAINMAFAAQSGPDCLLHVVKKYGLRLKVYKFFWDILNSDLEVNASLTDKPNTTPHLQLCCIHNNIIHIMYFVN